jgi:hypothetical protein
VPASDRPVAGKCTDCGRIVPVPKSPPIDLNPSLANSKLNDPEARTAELDAGDLVQLQEWAAKHAAKPDHVESMASTTGFMAIGGDPSAEPIPHSLGPAMPPASTVKFETGLRICPRCKRPVHLSAANCRECGTPVPRN